MHLKRKEKKRKLLTYMAAARTTTKETPAKKAAPKKAETITVKAEAVKPAPAKTTSKFEVSAFDLSGKEVGTVALAESVFGGKVNKSLLTQAMRVYNNNRQTHWGNTKTRGEVQGSTRKIFKQKGTGNARHGSLLAPIFVGGGIALGPKPRKVELDLPKKMKTAALMSALAQKQSEQQVFGLAGMEKASGKTKDLAVFAKKMNERSSLAKQGKKSMLIVGVEENEMMKRMVRNLAKISYRPASQLNVFEVIGHQSILVSKEAVAALVGRFEKKETKEEATNA